MARSLRTRPRLNRMILSLTKEVTGFVCAASLADFYFHLPVPVILSANPSIPFCAVLPVLSLRGICSRLNVRMFCSRKALYRIKYLSTRARVMGPRSTWMSLVLNKDGNVPRTCQLSPKGVQDLDLRSKLKPSTGDETDSHLQLPCFAAQDFPERNSLQDPLVDHILFRLEKHVCRENETRRCSVPALLRRHEQHGNLFGTYKKRF